MLSVDRHITGKKECLTYITGIVNNLCMLGRVLTYLKCPICNKPFSVLPDERGIICEEHKTVPTRFYINANQFKAGRLYSDPKGQSFDSFSLAHRQLETMRRDWDNKIFNPDDWIIKKVQSYRFENLAEEWLRGYELEVKGGTKANSYVRVLKQRMTAYLLPEFRKLDIRDIKEPQIRKFYHDLLEKDISPKSIKHILDTLRTLLNYYKNILARVPDMPHFTVVPKREKKWLGIDKQMMALSFIPANYALAFELLFETGMRPGELRALKKGDFRDGYITVSRAFSENSLRLITKTGAEVTYRVSFSLWRKLMEHIAEKPSDTFIFTLNGKPYYKDRLYDVWKRACQKADIDYITLYQASRHSSVSQIKKQKDQEAIEEIAKKLGHSNLSTAKKHYILGNKEEIK